jgi:hypothetical protein
MNEITLYIKTDGSLNIRAFMFPGNKFPKQKSDHYTNEEYHAVIISGSNYPVV